MSQVRIQEFSIASTLYTARFSLIMPFNIFSQSSVDPLLEALKSHFALWSLAYCVHDTLAACLGVAIPWASCPVPEYMSTLIASFSVTMSFQVHHCNLELPDFDNGICTLGLIHPGTGLSEHNPRVGWRV